MRIDLFLRLSRIVKKRSKAKELCDLGLVRVNGQVVKSSREIKVGDEVEINSVSRSVKFVVEKVPRSKKVSSDFIRVIEDKRKNIRDIIDLV